MLPKEYLNGRNVMNMAHKRHQQIFKENVLQFGQIFWRRWDYTTYDATIYLHSYIINIISTCNAHL